MGEAAKKFPEEDIHQAFLEVPDHLVAEILDGEVYTSPRPASPHARASSRMTMDIGIPFDDEKGGSDRPGGWWILDEPELHLGEDIVVPDLAGWRRERMPVIPNVPYFTLAPDWVCEVISPSTARIDRVLKTRIYAREGAGHLWMVDPLSQTLEVYQLEQGRWVLFGTYAQSERVRAVPFDAIELDLSRWWLPQAAK